MKNRSHPPIVAILLFASIPGSIFAQQFWDPDGATVGTSVSGNWDILTANWTASPDSGVNAVWTQGGDASFGVEADYLVTVTQPISVGNVFVAGSAGTLTIAGSVVNGLTLGGPSLFNIGGSRTVNVSAPIGGAFELTKNGNGTLSLSGANTYSGGTSISTDSGFIGIATDTVSAGGVITSSALGTGPVVVNTAGHKLFASGAARILENPVTLNAGLTISGSENLTFKNGNWLVAGATRIITVSNTALTRIESNLIDDGVGRTLQKAGPGTLVLAGTNSAFLGSLTVNANGGTLALGSDTALSVGSVVTVAAGGTLAMNGFKGTVVGLSGAGSVALGTNMLTIASVGTSRNFTGVISGTGGLIISNAISQQIEGSNTFSGGILVQVGTVFLRTNLTSQGISQAAGTGIITIEDNGGLPRAAIGANYASGVVRITNSIFCKTGRGLFFPSNGGANQFEGVISGPGGFLRDNNGSGLVIITGDNTFMGGLQFESRALALGHQRALGVGPFVIGNSTNLPGNPMILIPTVQLSGATAITNTTTVNQNFTVAATNDFELSGAMTLSNPVVITTIGINAVKISGRIDGPGGIAKAGTNSLILSGSNTYSAATSVDAGTLLVNNTSGSGTSTGTVSVAFDATLGGSGTIEGPVTVSFAGTIGAGSSAGKLTLMNGLDLSAGGTNVWELAADKDTSNGIAGTDFDQLSLTGGNLALGNLATLRVQFTGAASFPDSTNAFWQTNHSWRIISLSGAAANPGNSNFSAIDGTNDITAGTFATSVDGSGNVILSYIAAGSTPQPAIQTSIPGAGTTNATISWSSVSGLTYQVQYKNDLNDTNWTLLNSVTATNSTASIVDNTSPVPAQRFYRIIVP